MVIVVPQAVQKCRCPWLVVPGDTHDFGSLRYVDKFQNQVRQFVGKVIDLIELGNEHLIHKLKVHAATTRCIAERDSQVNISCWGY